MGYRYLPSEVKRGITKLGYFDNEDRDAAFRKVIRSIPKGKVSTYARVAEAAGYPLYHRAVARLLRKETLTTLPWQRIVGSGGEIRLKGEFANEQRLRLRMEGIRFEGKRPVLAVCTEWHRALMICGWWMLIWVMDWE